MATPRSLSKCHSGLTLAAIHVPHDPACELHAGDHEFIRHKSYIAYAHARIERSQKLVNGIKSGDLVPKTMLAQEIFARVCKGLAESRFTAPRIIAFYRAAKEARNSPE